MRVSFVIDSVMRGGTEKSVTDLALALRSLDVETSVVQLWARGGYEEELRAGGVEVQTLRRDGRRQQVSALRDLFRAQPPDVAHTQLFEADIVGRIAARRAGVPVVSSFVNSSYGREHRRAPGVSPYRLAAAQLLDAGTAGLVQRFHAVSHTVAATMSQRLRVDPRRVEVIPRGRSASALGRRTEARSAAVRAALGLSAADDVVLAVGRHEWQKGFDLLLDAIRRTDPRAGRAVLLVAGREGNATPDLRALAAEVDPTRWDVRFLGARDDVPDLMVAADLLVSSSRWEGLPGTLIEALATEVPIVATRIAPSLEVVEGLGGVRMVPPDDAGVLAAAVESVLLQRLETKGHYARFEQQFELAAVAAAMRTFYESAMDAA